VPTARLAVDLAASEQRHNPLCRRTLPSATAILFPKRQRVAAPSEIAPVVLADANVENVNAQVDELIHTGLLRRQLAFVETARMPV
jgi:hypothetical protein